MKDSATTPTQPDAEPQSQSRWTPDSPHRALRMALASASLLSLAAGAPLAARAADSALTPGQSAVAAASASESGSGVYVTILSPNPGTSLAGAKQVEIRAYYESSLGVSGVELFIDGQHMASQTLAKPEERGEISFVVEASALRAGGHTIVVRATATDEEVSSARAEMDLPTANSPAKSGSDAADGDFKAETTGGGMAGESTMAGGPTLGIVSPGPSATVQGIVEIKVDATDPSGKAPYVSLFVDHQFKTLRNFAPYTFDLDTNHLTNGKHTVEVWGYNDEQKVGHAKPLDILVNNPGGHTFERHDLLDDAPAAPKAHVIRGGAVISSHPPVLRATSAPRVHSAEFAIASRKSAPGRVAGVPSIAHTARKAMSQMIAKADRLASLGSAMSLESADGATVPASTMMAPAFTQRGVSSDTFETRTFATPLAPKAVAHTHSIVRKLQASQVPSLRAERQLPAPIIASLNPHSADTLTAIAASTSLESTSAAGALEDSNGNDVAQAMPLEQPKIKLRIHAAPVQHAQVIASSNLGGMSEAEKAKAEAIAEASKPQDQSQSHAKAAAGKNIVKSVASQQAKKSARNGSAHIGLADFRPHDIAALRGAEEVMVNQSPLDLSLPLQDRGAMLFAPMREIIERQGGTLDWNSATRQVSAVTANRNVKVTIGSRAALVNNQQVKLNSAPYLYNDRTMMPLDFFQKAMNATVSYDAANGHLVIQSK